MIQRIFAIVCLLVALLTAPLALAQTPSPETLATARELVATSRAAETMKAILPAIMQHMKPAIVQNRPEVEKDYDVVVGLLMKGTMTRLDELTDKIAVIYAINFTESEMKELIAFYRTPTGQKFLAKAPTIAQQSMAAGQKFGAEIGRELQSRIVEELRKKGHNI